MNYVELLTGVSPDGGNGSVELIMVVALALIMAVSRRLFRRSPIR